MISKFLNYVKNNKRNFILASVLIIALTVICIGVLSHNSKLSQTFYANEKNEAVIGGIWDNSEVVQTFVSTENYINSIALRFATYARECSGDITVELYKTLSDKDELIFTSTFAAAAIEDTKFRTFEFDPISDSKGKEFKIIITASGALDKPASIWSTNSRHVNRGILYLNEVETGSELNMKISAIKLFTFNDVVAIIFFALLIFAIIIMVRNKMFIFSDITEYKYIRRALAIPLTLFALASVKVSADDYQTFTRSPNIIPIVLFALTLLIALIFEPKLKFYRSVFEFIKNEADKFKKSLNEKDIIYVVLRAMLLLSWAAYISFTVFVIAFAYISAVYYKIAIILTVSVIILHLLYSVKYQKKLHSAYTFLIVSLLLGILFAYTLPACAGYSWDEHIHYENALSLKELFLNGRTHADIMQSAGQYRYNNLKDLQQNLLIMLGDSNTNVIVEEHSINIYSSISYLPYSLIMIISELLGMNHFTKILTAKIAAIAIYSFVIFSGIKKMKNGAYLFSAVALMPTCIFLAASFSYDAWTTAFTAYAFAYFFSELQAPEKKLTERDMLLMFGAMILACASKAVYFILLLPLLLFKNDKFEIKNDKYKYRISGFISMLLILLSFTIPFLINTDSRTDFRGGEDVNAGEQLKFILGNPFKYAQIFFTFIKEFITADSLNGSVTIFAYLGHTISVFGSISLLLIAFCIFADKGESDYGKAYLPRASSFFAVFLSILLTCTALYISFTPVQSPTIAGVQIRYLFPIMPIVCYCSGGAKTKSFISDSFMKLTVFGVLTFNALATYYDIFLQKIL